MKRTAILCMICTATGFSALGQQPGGFTYDRLLQRLDQNEDGALTQDEMRQTPGLFRRGDIDGDGTLTREEFEQGRARINNNRRQRPPRQRPVPEGVTAYRDLEYAVAEDQSLKLDLYLPAETEVAPPLLVWIHGGGWANGDKGNVQPAAFRLCEEGYAIASINYRLKDISIHPKNIHDCKGAVRWLRAHAEKYGYDPERIAVGGGSAGGHLSLLLGLSSGIPELEGSVGGHTNQSSAVRAVVDFYGPSELTVFADENTRFGGNRKLGKEFLKEASPLTYLTEGDPAVIIFHGDQDRTVPVSQSILVHERYQEARLPSELHVLEGSGHGGKAFATDAVHQQIKAFLDKHLADDNVKQP